MSRRTELIFKFLTIVTDIASIVLSYFFAFFIRTRIDTRPFFFNERSVDFISTILFLIPFWIIILLALGLYKKDILFSTTRTRENIRILIASLLGVMAIITVSFLKSENIFPIRLIALYTFFLCSIFLFLFRLFLRMVRKYFLKKGHHGIMYALIIGNGPSTKSLAEYFYNHPESGYRVVGIVAGNKNIPHGLKKNQFSSTKEALRKVQPDVIFQTDTKNTDYVFEQALNRYIPYYFIPSDEVLLSQLGEAKLIGETPAILVKTTPLDGTGAILKRIFDIIFSGLALILLFIPMFVIWLSIKISDPKHHAIYTDFRLTKGNKKFIIYKFRSIKSEYSGLTPEEAFEKMGKPNLSEKYRKNGDFLKNDPRITKLGAFLRKTSLDELPQFWNVLKGDISIVGPRALVPGELRSYGKKSQLLTVKSGLTGLAQVSGRRNISFDERRKLDLYYIHNWTLWLDFQIVFKTIAFVLKHEGAK